MTQKLFRFGKGGVLYIGSHLPMGDIDTPDPIHPDICVTASTKEEAVERLVRMAEGLKTMAVLRRTAGGVHAYFLKDLSLEEWADVHLSEGGDPLYTKYTLLKGAWWDRLSPKPGRLVDDDPEDFWLVVPSADVPPPPPEYVRLWQINCQARRLAHRWGTGIAREFLLREGFREVSEDRRP
jgi:hypothetical protein